MDKEDFISCTLCQTQGWWLKLELLGKSKYILCNGFQLRNVGGFVVLFCFVSFLKKKIQESLAFSHEVVKK